MKNYLDVWSHIRCKGKLIFQAVFDSQHAGLRTLVAWYHSFEEYFHSDNIRILNTTSKIKNNGRKAETGTERHFQNQE